MFKQPEKVDFSKFQGSEDSLEVKYGLPREVRFCKVCVMSNQKPNSEREYQHTKTTRKATMQIDSDMICVACRNAMLKDKEVDWVEREKQLLELCDRYRSKDGTYDCLVPGSGGKDSFYTAHLLKYKYGMHPLTVTFAPHMYTEWGWHNFQSWIHAGFDNYLFTPNGRVHRLLTRLATETILHPFQPFMIGQMYMAPRLAEKLNIPLVFYGENASEYGNKLEENFTPEKDLGYFTVKDWREVHLGGISAEELMSEWGLNFGDLEPYLPADPNRLRDKKIRVQYLGYYVKWHPQATYYYAVENGNFQACPERNPGTYSKYSSLDDKVEDFNFYTMHVKFGIGRCSYDAAQEIRNGEITREEGVALVRRFDGEFPERFAEDIF